MKEISNFVGKNSTNKVFSDITTGLYSMGIVYIWSVHDEMYSTFPDIHDQMY